MRSTTATRTSTDSAEAMPARPRIGLLGIMQALYDDMLPGITERQAAYARELGDALAGVADVEVAAPARDRDDIDRTVADFERQGLDGLLVVMLTYGPGMRVSRALSHTPLPICLANVQPVPGVTAEWDMADLTYNQGIHGAQDTANAMVRAGRPFHVITDDWHADSFAEAVGGWARAAAAVSRWRALKVAVFGYAMNGMGDIRVDVHALLRALGPQVDALAPGALHRATQAVSDDDVRALMADEDARFEIDPRLQRRRARGPRAHAARPRGAAARGRLRRLLDALRRHRRGRPLRAPAARRRLEPHGQGLRLRRRGRRADRGAHGGRARAAGRHAVHRDVRDGLPQRLDPDEPHGRGQLGAGARRSPRQAHQAPAGHRRPRRPADLPLSVRDGPRDAGHARVARRRALPAAGLARARSSTPTSCRRSRCPTASSVPTRACASA